MADWLGGRRPAKADDQIKKENIRFADMRIETGDRESHELFIA
jgi:hypothetical protein